MQESPRPLYARAGALGAAALLAVSGAFIAGPAMATTGETPQPAATEAPAVPAVEGTEAPVEDGAATLAPGLSEALQRDLGMTVEEFLAAGELGKKASDALDRLKATDGFVSIELVDGALVITGSGEDLQTLATELDATVVDPAPATEAPAEEAPAEEAPVEEAPAPEQTEAPAPAENTTEAPEEEAAAPLKRASDLRSLLQDYADATGAADKLQSVTGNAGSGFVLTVGEPATELGGAQARAMAAPMTAEEFAATYENVTVTDPQGLPENFAETDIPNGLGYLFESGDGLASACSIGFNGFNAAGDDAVISAGHCAEGAAGPLTILEHNTQLQLGMFGTYSFDGTEANPGTDISVIDSINPDLTLLPETLQWANAEDLEATTVQITGSTTPVAGAPICKSGRTSFWTCGTILSADALFNAEGTWTEGFQAELDAAPGDSGGSMISGSLAVGLISAGVPGSGKVYGVDLARSMAAIPGYSVAIHLAAPALTSPADGGTVETDAPITGTAPAGSTVQLSLNGEESEVLAGPDGTWSTTAPTLVPEGAKLEITAQAVNGFNKSTVSEFELTVKEAPLPVPVFTTPATVLNSLSSIEGTGVAGATVSVSIPDDQVENFATRTIEVDEEGNWAYTLEEPLSYGVYEVTARQGGIEGKEDSAAAELNLTVAPEAPVITNPADGSEFTQSELPDNITGTAKPGALVLVSFDGQPAVELQADDNGNWSAPMGDLAVSSHGVEVTQVYQGAPSAAAFVSFIVNADPAPVAPVAPAGNPGTGGLPDTGASNIALLAGGGATLLAAGAAAVLYTKRRRVLADA
ncbi:trypsin-like serine protease [Arthrobacter sp. YD2]|uniref:trypsin-like serine protease n=1 Tax=Arthrobacter sp. YD2 TaxID=3058046 RepID=UPI0025B2CF3E|nr:trypsin-like serine protease [Arthrobacter sp. YD2]MDN3903171.1 trypsin-like serine protease [Arthrobacter sp. YD2]